MKTNYLLSAAIAVVSLGLTSCSQSEDVADSTTAKQTITFASGEDDTTTRTSMGGAYTDTSFPFYWEAGDAIWVNATDKITGSNTGTASYALFTGSVSTSAPYKIRYTGTGSYTSTNQRDATYSFTTTSDANTLVIPPVQSIATWAEGAATSRIGANGDCGTATATGSGTSYSFKLAHKASYLIIMPRWGTGGTNTTYKLKSVTVTTNNGKYYLISGRFGFDDFGIGSTVTNTYGSPNIKITTGGNDGLTLPTTKDQTKSINIAIKPVSSSIPLYCIYEVSDGTNTYYIEKILPSKSYDTNKITPITADLKAGYDAAVNNPAENGGSYLDVIKNKNPYSGFYEWDAPYQAVGEVSKGEESFVGFEKGYDYNATTTDVASANCKKCPTYNQISWYLKGGCYWDATKKWGPADNQKGGMWFKKKEVIIAEQQKLDPTFNEDTFNGTKGATSATSMATAPSAIELSTDWFFMPAAGVFVFSKYIQYVGTVGDYWSNTPIAGSKMSTWRLQFQYESSISAYAASLNGESRVNGQCLWNVQ